MYISVFQWSPYENSNSIKKLFPNQYDINNFFKSKTKYSIPTSDKFEEYSLRTHFPDDNNVLSDDVFEFLMIIGTKEKIDFLDSYNYSNFGAKLADIETFRQYRKSYIIRKRVD